MPAVRDFRNFSFSSARIDRCGRHLGSKLYWKLYVIENTIRIVIHSVLTQQLGANWWGVALDPKLVPKVTGRRRSYIAKPNNASPGGSDIHLLYLGELTDIVRANSHQFVPVVPDANNWVAILESIRVPRNLVGHMNFPNSFDRGAIEFAYSRLPSLLGHLAAHHIPVLIPK
jgi:hypothetical protein